MGWSGGLSFELGAPWMVIVATPMLEESNVTSTKYYVLPVLSGGQILPLHPLLASWQVILVRMVTPVPWLNIGLFPRRIGRGAYPHPTYRDIDSICVDIVNYIRCSITYTRYTFNATHMDLTYPCSLPAPGFHQWGKGWVFVASLDQLSTSVAHLDAQRLLLWSLGEILQPWGHGDQKKIKPWGDTRQIGSEECLRICQNLKCSSKDPLDLRVSAWIRYSALSVFYPWIWG